MSHTPLRFVVIPAIILFFSGCSRTDQQQQAQPSGSSSGKGDNVALVTGVTKRPDQAPNFSWKDSTGAVVDLDSYHGSVTLINFWATWCGPCKRELPDLVSLSREMAGRKVKFIGVSTDRGPGVLDDVRSFVREHDIPYQIVVSNDDLEDAFGNPRAIPTTFLIDASGKVSQPIVGMRSKEFFAQAIASLLH